MKCSLARRSSDRLSFLSHTHLRVMIMRAALLCFCLPLASARLALWPEPLHVESGHDALWLDSGLRVTLVCGNESQYLDLSDSYSGQLQSSIAQALGGWQIILGIAGRGEQRHDTASLTEQQYLQAAVRETFKQIRRSNFIPWKFHPKATAFEPDPNSIGRSLAVLEIAQTSCPASKFRPSSFFGVDEAYEITVEDATARIRTQSTLATMRALGKSYSDFTVPHPYIRGIIGTLECSHLPQPFHLMHCAGSG